MCQNGLYTRLEIKLEPCYFESQNRCTGLQKNSSCPPRPHSHNPARPHTPHSEIVHPPSTLSRARLYLPAPRRQSERLRGPGQGGGDRRCIFILLRRCTFILVIPQACFRMGPPLSSLLRVPSGASSGVTLRRGDRGGMGPAPRALVRGSFIGPPLSSLLRVPSGASSGVTPRRGDGRRHELGCVVASVA